MEPINTSNVNNSPLNQNVNQDTTIQNPTLPPEVVMLIFSQLDAMGSEQASAVNKIFNPQVLNSVKNEEINLLKSFVESLIANIKIASDSKEVGKVVEELEKVLVSVNVLKPFNLLTVKSSLMNVKNDVIKLLKSLNMDMPTLGMLTQKMEYEKTPVSWNMEVYPGTMPTDKPPFNHFFYLVASDEENVPQHFLQEAVSELFMFGLVDKAINLANKFNDEIEKRNLLLMMSALLLEAGYLKKANEIAEGLGIDKNNIYKELGTLSPTLRSLVKNEKIDEILEIAGKLATNNKDALFGLVAKEFFKNGKPENATKFYYLMSNSSEANKDAFFEQQK